MNNVCNALNEKEPCGTNTNRIILVEDQLILGIVLE